MFWRRCFSYFVKHEKMFGEIIIAPKRYFWSHCGTKS